MGSDTQRQGIILFKPISIHAPAWGATKQEAETCLSVIISIHAPAWGATLSPLHRSTKSAYFNPRSRMGSDPTEIALF